MSKLLYIQSSPRKERSVSTRIADKFIDSYRKSHPEDEAEVMNLFELSLPAFDGYVIQSKYDIMHNQEFSEEQRHAWIDVERIIGHFKSADKYLFSVPMWNFGIPYRLKHYIDLIVQPGYVFTVDESGYRGLVTGRPAAVIYARGGEYTGESGMADYDIQSRYMRTVLGFMGFEQIEEIFAEPTLQGGPELAEERIGKALQRAEEMAVIF